MYKVFNEQKGRPRLLYHGLRGQRDLPLDTWLDAEVKWVSEGSNPYYWSAFHVYTSLDSVSRWKHRTRKSNGRVVVEVSTGEVEKKPTRGEAWLARRMMVTADQWSRRTPLSEI